MKFSSLIRSIIFLLSISIINSSVAQDFAVTTKGDTLYGKVKPVVLGADKKVIVVGADKKKTTLSLFQTRSYTLKGEVYQPVKGDRGYTFMKLLKPGYLSLYAFQLENQTMYDGQYLVKKDGHGIEIPNLSFKKVMTKFLSDNPVLSAKIEDGTYGKKDINDIIYEYNDFIERTSRSQQQAIAVKKEQLKGILAWDALEEKVKSEPDFTEKANALDMINEIKNKVKGSEKIPNFLSEGLKAALQNTSLKGDLESLLSAN